MRQGGSETGRSSSRHSRGIGVQFAINPPALLRIEPSDCRGRIRQEKENGDTYQRGRETLDKEEPLPSAQAKVAIKREQRRRCGSHNRNCEGAEKVEAADRPPALRTRKPMREIIDHAR